MGTSLAVIEKNFTSMMPQLQQAFPVTVRDMDANRLVRSIVIACEKTPALLNCDLQSIVNGAYSAACLGLPLDGTTGQASLIPRKGKACLEIEFKGFRTIAARSGFLIETGVIWEGDKYEVKMGSGGFVSVWPSLEPRNNRRILAFFAIIKSKDFPEIVELMTVDQVDEIRKVSMNSSGSTWTKNYSEMGRKTVCKRGAKSVPNAPDLHLAVALDDMAQIGNDAYIRPTDRALIVQQNTGGVPDVSGAEHAEDIVIDGGGAPERFIINWPDGTSSDKCTTGALYEKMMIAAFNRITDTAKLELMMEKNAELINTYGLHIDKNVKEIRRVYEVRKSELAKVVDGDEI
jgi:recombination protein RecT